MLFVRVPLFFHEKSPLKFFFYFRCKWHVYLVLHLIFSSCPKVGMCLLVQDFCHKLSLGAIDLLNNKREGQDISEMS